MASINLDDINYALQQLVRMQLAGELSAEAAWRERQQLLDAVEANWADVPDVVTNEIAPVKAADPAPAESRRRQQLKAMRRLWRRLRRLGLLWALLGMTIATCVYVASL